MLTFKAVLREIESFQAEVEALVLHAEKALHLFVQAVFTQVELFERAHMDGVA